MIHYFKKIALLKRIIKINNHFVNNKNLIIPYKYNFDITYGCNSRCITCNIWKIYENSCDLNSKELSVDEYEKIFKSLNNNIFFASLEGGEPFLRKDLSAIVNSLFNNSGNLIYLMIASNGSMPEKIENTIAEIQKNNKKNIPVILSLSLDGPENIHNKIRGLENSYNLVFDSYNRIKKYKNIKVVFQTTICKSNWKYLLDFHNSVDNEIIYTLAHSSQFFNNLDSNNEDVFSIEEKNEFVRFLNELSRKIRIKSISSFLNKLYLKHSVKYLTLGHSVLPCYASYATMNIDPYGNLSKCAFSKEKIVNFRNIDYNINNYLHRYLQESEPQFNVQCNKCWMNCDALPSILQTILSGNILKALNV